MLLHFYKMTLFKQVQTGILDLQYNEIFDCTSHMSIFKRNIFFKAENLQKTGSFKARGAINAVLQLDKSIQAVCCDSSGNHGQALSWAAAEFGKHCHVAVPKVAPEVKVTAIKEFHK